MSGSGYYGEKEPVSLRTRFDGELEEMIKWLHTSTTEVGKNKWNKAKFNITPDNKFDMEFVWHQEAQD